MPPSVREGLSAFLLPFGLPFGEATAGDGRPAAAADGRGGARDVERLGAKGAGLLKLVRLGLPVPGGVVLTTALCEKLRSAGRSADGTKCVIPEPLWQELWPALETMLEAARQAEQARRPGPVLWAVRSSPCESVPGMLYSLLNLGLDGETLTALAAATADRRAALDCYRRLLTQWALMVHGVRIGLAAPGMGAGEPGLFPNSDGELRAQALAYERELRQRTGLELPARFESQLRLALGAVLHSFERPAVRDLRRLQGQSDEVRGAVVIQAMVLGNLGQQSASGVAFTRDPATGAPGLYGEFLESAQGEDIVAGSHTPRPLAELAATLPEAYRELSVLCRRIEAAEADLQDIEFGIERGRLYFLQTRTGRRSARAMVRIACDLVREGLLDPSTALLRIEPQRLIELQRPRLLPLPAGTDAREARPLLCQGLPASPGVVVGRVVLSVADVEQAARLGESPILVRTDTSTDDIIGIKLAVGVLTARGGLTSHAAVVARGLGRCAVVGASSLRIDVAGQSVAGREHVVWRGELLTLDGHSGEVFVGAQPLVLPELGEDAELSQILSWSRERRRLQVRALAAPSPGEFRRARAAGADGIGLCRVESLFLGAAVQPLVEELVRHGEAAASGARKRLVARLAQELHGLLRELPGRPVALRLFDAASAVAWLEMDGPPSALVERLRSEPTATQRLLWAVQLEALRAACELAGPEPLPQLQIFLTISDEKAAEQLPELRARLLAGGGPVGLRIAALLPTSFVGALDGLAGADAIGIACNGRARLSGSDEAQAACSALLARIRAALPDFVGELGLADPGPTGLSGEWVARCERERLHYVTAGAEALLGAQVAAAQAVIAAT